MSTTEALEGNETGVPGVGPGHPPSAQVSSFRQILRSSAVIGGSTLITVGFGMIRAKAMAMLIGPAGFGLVGIYTSITDLVRSVAEMGINSSGVRQIAAAAGSGDAERLARTVKVLRRISLFLGALGGVLLLLLARPISQFTFGNEHHEMALSLLGLAVFFRLVADGQGGTHPGYAPHWGPRQGQYLGLGIRHRCEHCSGGLAGGEAGVVPALIFVGATAVATSTWYSRKVSIANVALDHRQIKTELSDLMTLGFSFMVSALLTTAAGFATRWIVLDRSGLEAAGLYQAAWTLAGLYVGFVLQAMGADFYPRLVGAAEDHVECNRMVNDQAQVSMLLAGPGVLATLTLASTVLVAFYSSAFAAAADLLRWTCLGMMLRVVSWPMGFIIIAKGARHLFLSTEIAWAAAFVGLTWGAVQVFGLQGAGIAFFASYVFHCAMLFLVTRRLSGFRWTHTSLARMSVYLTLAGPYPTGIHDATCLGFHGCGERGNRNCERVLSASALGACRTR